MENKEIQISEVKQATKKLRYSIIPFLADAFFAKRTECTGKRPLKSIAVLRPGKLGDMLVITPLLHLLKKHAECSHCTVVSSLYNEIIVRHNPHVDEIKPVNFHCFADVAQCVGWIRRRHFDAIIDCTPGISNTSFLISQIAGKTSLLAGFHKAQMACYYDVVYTDDTVHLCMQAAGLFELMTGHKVTEVPPIELRASERDTSTACDFFSSNGLEKFKMILGINLSAGSPERQWSPEKYGRLIELLQEVSAGWGTMAIVLFSAGRQHSRAQVLSRRFEDVFVVPQTGFLTVSEMLARTDLLISPDTAMIPAACAHKVPVVGLYRDHRQTLTRWGPFGVPFRIVKPSGGSSFEFIKPEDVCEATCELAGID
ncbi:MAG: hypothetical protein GF350_06125 [Chitinivibrionales bacterium]|nr:hypothetical protein [Chitinivibrionales bacterium]